MVDKNKDKDKVSKTISPEKSEKLKKDEKVKEERYFEQPPSDSEDDICGPLNCDKQL